MKDNKLSLGNSSRLHLRKMNKKKYSISQNTRNVSEFTKYAEQLGKLVQYTLSESMIDIYRYHSSLKSSFIKMSMSIKFIDRFRKSQEIRDYFEIENNFVYLIFKSPI